MYSMPRPSGRGGVHRLLRRSATWGYAPLAPSRRSNAARIAGRLPKTCRNAARPSARRDSQQITPALITTRRLGPADAVYSGARCARLRLERTRSPVRRTSASSVRRRRKRVAASAALRLGAPSQRPSVREGLPPTAAGVVTGLAEGRGRGMETAGFADSDGGCAGVSFRSCRTALVAAYRKREPAARKVSPPSSTATTQRALWSSWRSARVREGARARTRTAGASSRSGSQTESPAEAMMIPMRSQRSSSDCTGSEVRTRATRRIAAAVR